MLDSIVTCFATEDAVQIVNQYSHRILKSHNKSSLSDVSVIAHYHIKSSNHSFGSSFRVHDSPSVATNHKLPSVALDHRLTPNTAPPAFNIVACVNSGVACYVTVGSAGVGGWGVDLPVTVAAAALVTLPLVGEGVPCIARIRHSIVALAWGGSVSNALTIVCNEQAEVLLLGNGSLKLILMSTEVSVDTRNLGITRRFRYNG
jgi:hypothetical protein